jgi:tetratricopeptide (TPR) repeat protein/predicted secreted protein
MFFVGSAVAPDVKIHRWKLLSVELSVILLAGAWFVFNGLEFKQSIPASCLHLPLLVWCLLILIHYVVAPDKMVAGQEFERMLLGLGIYFVIASAPWGIKQRRIVLGVWVLSASVISLYVLGQYWGWSFGRVQIPRMSRPFGTFGNPLFFAAYLVTTIPVAWSLALTEAPPPKFLWWLCSLVMIIALYATKARGGWVGFGIALILFIAVYLRRKGAARKTIALALTALAIIAGVFVWSNRLVWLRQTHRLLIWRDTAVMGLKNPFGVGIGGFHTNFPKYASEGLKEVLPQNQFIVNYAHNEYLEVFAETGIVGLSVFLWMLVLFWKEGLKASYQKDSQTGIIALGLLSGGVALLGQNFFCVNMRFIISSVYLFMVMGLVVNAQASMQVAGRGTVRYNAGKQPKVSFLSRICGLLIGVFIIGYFTPQIWKPFRASQIVENEKFFEESGDYSVIKELKDKAKKGECNYDDYYKLGYEYAKHKQWQEAITSFEQALRIQPNSRGAYNNLGNIYYMTNRRRAAIECYERSIAIKPDQADAHFNLGYLYYMEGQLAEAASEFQKVLKYDPDNAKARIMYKKMVE